MSIIEPGATAPEFTLKREDGSDFTQEDLKGGITVLVFYPFAFSAVCTDQLQIYEEALEDFRAQGATLYGVSTDAPDSQRAFKEKLGISIEQLSDFEPGGMTNRALVITDSDGVVRWSHLAANPGELPGVGLIFDGLASVSQH